MASDWIKTARDRLLAGPTNPGWPYRHGGAAFAEPTAIVGLALRAAALPAVPQAVRRAADWLAAIQQPDGRVGLSDRVPDPGWPTPHAILLWSALGGYELPRRKAVRWLLARRGVAFPRDQASPFGHDTSLVGWPWVDGTHSWLEPTAWAILAAGRARPAGHPRLAQGVRLIRDRAIPSGGWNYGNSTVFGSALCPQPAPTGLALLALRAAGAPCPRVQPALAYLRRSLPQIRAPRSLGWGLLGMAAWDARPPAAERWLAEAFSHRGEDFGPMELATLVLAACPTSTELLGVHQLDTPAPTGRREASGAARHHG